VRWSALPVSRLVLLVAPLLVALALAQAAAAVSVTITRTDDGASTPGGCTGAPFDCTLRAAVAAVEGDPSLDRTIVVPPGFYPLSSYLLLGDLTLAGSDPLTTVIDASSANDRVIVIFPDTTVAITGVTIAHGNALDNSSKGGAINNNSGGTLTLTDCVVRDSSCDGAGGGISSTGSLTLIRTVVSGNKGRSGGGGIFNQGSLTVTDSTIDGNQSFTPGGGGEGGGVFNAGGVAVLTGSTISNNKSDASGGGLVNIAATMTLTNCTVSGNNAEAGTLHGKMGGGIHAFALGLLTLNNVTVTANTASSGGGITAESGALNAQNSIIAGNHDPMGGSSDCQGTLTSLGYDLVGDPTGCTITGSSVNLTGVDPLLGPLTDNGGPTKTHALLAGSPAIDAADPAAPGSVPRACADVDQRGVARPQPAGGLCDMGAVELASSTTTTIVSTGTTSTTTAPPPAPEICGDCLDNDGNGLTDLEDPACCTAGGAMLTLKASRLTSAKGGSKVKLGGTLAGLAGSSAPQDLLIQMRAAGRPDFLCARIPGAKLVRRGTKETFKDPAHAVAAAHGIDVVGLKQAKNGSVTLKVGGKRLALSLPSAGTLDVTVGLADPATGAADGRCATAAAPFKGSKKGALKYP
jgi:hypothetical protein